MKTLYRAETTWKDQYSSASYYRNYPQKCKTNDMGAPHLQCTCEKCDNIDKMSSKLIGNQFSGIDRNLKKAMESMWCPFKYDLKERRWFPDKNCVWRECQKCGVDQLKQKISYPQGKNFKKKVHWEEWIYQKIDKKKYKMANDLRTVDLQVLFDNYIDKMEDLSEHVFFDKW